MQSTIFKWARTCYLKGTKVYNVSSTHYSTWGEKSFLLNWLDQIEKYMKQAAELPTPMDTTINQGIHATLLHGDTELGGDISVWRQNVWCCWMSRDLAWLCSSLETVSSWHMFQLKLFLPITNSFRELSCITITPLCVDGCIHPQSLDWFRYWKPLTS